MSRPLPRSTSGEYDPFRMTFMAVPRRNFRQDNWQPTIPDAPGHNAMLAMRDAKREAELGGLYLLAHQLKLLRQA